MSHFPSIRTSILGLLAVASSCAAPPSEEGAAHGSASVAPSAPTSSNRASARAEAAQRLRVDVAWLADDARDGRRAGTPAALACARYLADRFEALGLAPAGQNGWFQEFDVPLEPVSLGGSSVERKGGVRIEERSGELAPLFCAEEGRVVAECVWVGFGIEEPDLGWNDYAAIDVEGKVAVCVRGAPKIDVPVPPSDPNAPVNPHGGAGASADPFANAALVFTKVMNAKRHGAKAVILVQAPGSSDPLLRFSEGGHARASIPCVTTSWLAAEGLVGAAASGWKSNGASSPMDAARAATGVTLAVVAEVRRGRGPARNVLGRIVGVDSSRIVVVGAHYDHLGHGGTGSLADSSTSIHNGADDNASGTAAVLEIARRLKSGPKPECDVVFALWSGEELGLLGSEYWCEHPTVPREQVVANLNLDMVGRAGNHKLQVLAAGSALEFPGWMESAGANAELELQVSSAADGFGGSSDHASFLRRKIPAIHLFSGLHEDYHKPTDDTERFEADGAARVVDLSVALLDRLTTTPSFSFVDVTPTKEASRARRGGFRAWFGSIPNYTWDQGGVLIDGTSAGSPAQRAGFLKGDVLLRIGEVELATIDDFTYSLQFYKPGDVVQVRYRRDGKEETSTVTLASRGVK